jgi:hypothetical protein
MQTIALITEKSGKILWGRVTFDDNLMVADASTIEQLETKLRELIKDFHHLDDVVFEIN